MQDAHEDPTKKKDSGKTSKVQDPRKALRPPQQKNKADRETSKIEQHQQQQQQHLKEQQQELKEQKQQLKIQQQQLKEQREQKEQQFKAHQQQKAQRLKEEQQQQQQQDESKNKTLSNVLNSSVKKPSGTPPPKWMGTLEEAIRNNSAVLEDRYYCMTSIPNDILIEYILNCFSLNAGKV